MEIVWLVVVVGGPILLGGILGFGVFRRHPRRFVYAMAGAAIVAVLATSLSFVVGSAPTAPSNAPDRQGAHYDGPARPSDRNALPGLNQPTR